MRKRYYVTFGQVHRHELPCGTFDKDCVATFEADTYEEARRTATSAFGRDWCFISDREPDMERYFKAGLKELVIPEPGKEGAEDVSDIP